MKYRASIWSNTMNQLILSVRHCLYLYLYKINHHCIVSGAYVQDKVDDTPSVSNEVAKSQEILSPSWLGKKIEIPPVNLVQSQQ